MKAFLLSLCVLFSITTFAQAPAIQWQKSLGGTSSDYTNAVVATADGGYIMAGGSTSSNGDVTGNHGADDGWIVKLSVSGSLQWQKNLGGSDGDIFQSISQTIDGGYIAVGYSYSNNGDITNHHGNAGAPDCWVVKLTGAGDVQWQESLGGSAYDDAYDIKQTADSGYIIAGRSASNDGDVSGNHGPVGYLDYWIVKLNSKGNLQWQKCLGGTSNDGAYSVQLTPDGGYVVIGYAMSTDGDVTNGRGGNRGNGFWLVKLNSSGNIQWQKILGNHYANSNSYCVQLTKDGGYIVSGLFNDTDYGLIKVDSNGNVKWEKTFGGSGYDLPMSLQITPDGNYLLAGGSESTDGTVTGNHGDLDAWIIKIDTSGNLMWQKSFGGKNEDIANCIQVTADGGYIMAGYSLSNDGDVSGHHGNVGSSDAWIVKLNDAGAKYIAVTASPSSAICSGTPITFTATTSTTGTYRWKKNHINVGINSPIYKDSTLQNGDTVLCTLTTSDSIITSNAIRIAVSTPYITITGSSVLCAGSTATYKATATLAGHVINYQWKKNNVNAGSNSNLYTDSHITDKDSIWCTIVTDAFCKVSDALTSNKIIVTVPVTGAVSATVVYQPSNYRLCAQGDTTTIKFHATGQYGGASPSFQWWFNNQVVGTDSSFYTAHGVKNGDKIYCRYTSSQKCVTGDVHTVNSNTVTITNKIPLTPAIAIMQTPDTTVCFRTKVRFKINGYSGGGEAPVFQWMKNGLPVGTNSDVYYDSLIANGDTIWCKMTSNYPCVVSPTVSSNKIAPRVDYTFPLVPSAINGLTTVTAGAQQVGYLVNRVNDVSYLWSLPAGASFYRGQHTNQVLINWGNTGGLLIVQARNSCGYSAQSRLTVTVTPALQGLSSVEEQSTISGIASGKAQLYPNPATTNTTVSFTAAAAGKYIVQVVDASGRILQVKETNAVKGRNTININVSGYAKGSYFVRLSNKDGKQQATFTLVVAR